MGYENIHISEKAQNGGGISISGVPQNRAPIEESLWEVEMVKQLGVKVHYGKKLGTDFTLEDLRTQGYEVCLSGVGLQDSNMVKMIKNSTIPSKKASKHPRF